MLVNPSEHIQQQLFWYGYYEKELGDLIRKILLPGDIFLDIGANIGYFSLLAAKHQPTARIFSFEPVSPIFNLFEQNISLNDIKNITAINSAVGEANSENYIYISGADNTGMSSFQKPENYSGSTEKVKIVSIDEWFSNSGLSKIDLIKLDIEGSELSALKGMKEALLNFKPAVVSEINPEMLRQFNTKAVDIFNYLNDLNFCGFFIFKSGEIFPIDSYETTETNNVLFIHKEKVEHYNQLL